MSTTTINYGCGPQGLQLILFSIYSYIIFIYDILQINVCYVSISFSKIFLHDIYLFSEDIHGGFCVDINISYQRKKLSYSAVKGGVLLQVISVRKSLIFKEALFALLTTVQESNA